MLDQAWRLYTQNRQPEHGAFDTQPGQGFGHQTGQQFGTHPAKVLKKKIFKKDHNKNAKGVFTKYSSES